MNEEHSHNIFLGQDPHQGSNEVKPKKRGGDQVMTLNLADLPQRSQMKLGGMNSNKKF
jgi:hypothetical protein